MNRRIAFDNLREHSWYSRYYARLKASERDFCVTFIQDNDHLNKIDFEMKINRLFIDDKNRPRNASIICDLLLAINCL